MKMKSLISEITGVFNQIKWPEPVKRKIIGKWHLFEFYKDKDNELLHFDEAQLKLKNFMLVFSVIQNHDYIIAGGLPAEILDVWTEGKWSISRNYLTLVKPNEVNCSIEFQFAINKETLKILKKDKKGNIEFFGLFRKDM